MAGKVPSCILSIQFAVHLRVRRKRVQLLLFMFCWLAGEWAALGKVGQWTREARKLSSS